MNDTKKISKRALKGTVVSTKMAKTIVVKVDRVLVHPKYGKRYQSSKRYLVDAPDGKFQEGQEVEFIECRPLSRLKRWRVINKSEG